MHWALHSSLLTPWSIARSCRSSMSTLAKATLPSLDAMSDSRRGPRSLHGPHHLEGKISYYNSWAACFTGRDVGRYQIMIKICIFVKKTYGNFEL